MPSTTPFQARPQSRLDLLRQLFRRSCPDAAVVEINNLLAAASNIRAISAADIAAICDRYRVTLGESFASQTAALYRDYLFYCLADHHLTAEELGELRHLQRILALDGATVQRIHRQVTRQVYARSVDEVLADGTVDADERLFLQHLQEHLDIPEDLAESILEIKKRQRRAREAPPTAKRPRPGDD